ncbi:hypothetical protein [Blastococcus sp. CT_GayMR16]|uniref:hypothetical protein n=1 Tax=Blastococcus sp. CT_GayMR16 TaxID=2559607 RepID=UPI001073796A|nr:hypothetical protein [Blastococcus sp. CT_GayMR16]TFV90698.1 hypothetical protein E4P38_04660 [Blastococcus sp. CT_GayMR16]
MAISVLDVRDTFVAPHVSVPARATVAAAEAAPRRLPLTVVSAGLIGVLEAVGLLAVALTGLDGVLTSPWRPAGWIVAGGLVLLAGWIVLCAGSGAALIDGAGRKLLLGVAYAEMALVAMLLVLATALPIPTPGDLPVPLLGLLALTVPVGKLLLAGAPSARAFVAQGPRTRVRRADPVQTHRLLATVTLGVIGLSLAAVAVLAPVPTSAPNDVASVFTQP